MSSQPPLDVCCLFSVTATWHRVSESELILHIHTGLYIWQHLTFFDVL
jgi:hypothetical protein